EAERRRVEGDGSALLRSGDPVREQPQPGHVRAGDPDAQQRLEKERAGKSSREPPETRAGGGSDETAHGVDPPPIAPTRQRGPVRDRGDVPAKEPPAHYARP